MKVKGWCTQVDPLPTPAALQHPPGNTPAQRIPLSRLAGSALRSAGSQMPSLAFAFTVLVATIALLFGHWTSANLHRTNNTTERNTNREDRVSKLVQWRSEMHLLLFMQLSRSSSRTQSLSSHRSTRKRTFNNIRVKHSSISARATRFSLTNTPPQLLPGQLLYTASPWSPDLALSNQSELNPAQLWLVLKRGPS